MTLIGWLTIWILISAIVRILRPRYAVVDTIVWGLLALATVAIFFGTDKFGDFLGLLIFMILPAGIAVYFIGGFNKETKNWAKKDGIGRIDCEKCGYNDLDVIADLDHGCIARCKRCGDCRCYLKTGERFSDEDNLIIKEY